MAERELQLVEESEGVQVATGEKDCNVLPMEAQTLLLFGIYVAMHFTPLLFGIYFLYLVYKNNVGIQIRNC